MANTYKFVGEAGIKELMTLLKNFAFKVKFVTALPDTGDERTLYMLKVDGASGDNLFDEYVWNSEDSKWELIGSATLDINLSDYAKKADFSELKDYVENLAKAIEDIEDGEITKIEVDTTSAPEISADVSKTATTATIKLTTDLSDYAKTADLDTFEEITASDVDDIWDSLD